MYTYLDACDINIYIYCHILSVICVLILNK